MLAHRHCRKMAGSYMSDFAQGIQNICNQVQSRRLWFSDKWADTEAGKDKELRCLNMPVDPVPYLRYVYSPKYVT